MFLETWVIICENPEHDCADVTALRLVMIFCGWRISLSLDTEDKMFAAYNFLSNAAEKARKEGKKKVASERASCLKIK